MPVSLWWVRRDLRLGDNPVIQSALAAGYNLIPVFIIDPHLIKKAPPVRLSFLYEGLRLLDESLQQNYGVRLIVRQGESASQLAQLFGETGSLKIYAEEDYSPYARMRDREVAKRLPLELITGVTVHHPAVVAKAGGKPYKVFSAFKRRWDALPFPGEPARGLPFAFAPVTDLYSFPIPKSSGNRFFPAGEVEASRRLETFIEGPISNYGRDRDRLDLNGTAGISPYLRFGMLSINRAVREARNSEKRYESNGVKTENGPWLNELIWREFYYSILYHFPYVLKQAFQPNRRNITWRDDELSLRAWQEGLTGYPIVDACMRQLLETGWMHNRGRMITASFLVKDLLINWQEGERWFMSHLIDGDPAANNGGWQWTAGVGTDAAPYFRILNPVAQSKKWDPEGQFIRRWVPELGRVPTQYIHEPWLMPDEVQSAFRSRIGADYPQPIIDHQISKERTINAFRLSAANYIQTDL